MNNLNACACNWILFLVLVFLLVLILFTLHPLLLLFTNLQPAINAVWIELRDYLQEDNAIKDIHIQAKRGALKKKIST